MRFHIKSVQSDIQTAHRQAASRSHVWHMQGPFQAHAKPLTQDTLPKAPVALLGLFE